MNLLERQRYFLTSSVTFRGSPCYFLMDVKPNIKFFSHYYKEKKFLRCTLVRLGGNRRSQRTDINIYYYAHVVCDVFYWDQTLLSLCARRQLEYQSHFGHFAPPLFFLFEERNMIWFCGFVLAKFHSGPCRYAITSISLEPFVLPDCVETMLK